MMDPVYKNETSRNCKVFNWIKVESSFKHKRLAKHAGIGMLDPYYCVILIINPSSSEQLD